MRPRLPWRALLVVLAFVSAELLLRSGVVSFTLAAPNGPARIPEEIASPRVIGYSPSLYVASDDFGMQMKPGYRGLLRRPDFVSEVVLNQDGFHDDEFEREPRAGEFRIAVMGTSVAAANQVPVDETWVNRLEQGLARRFPERRINVMNFGVPGHNLFNRVAMLEHLVLDFAPDMVVLHSLTDHQPQTEPGMQRVLPYRGYALSYNEPSELKELRRRADLQLSSLQYLPSRYLYLSRLMSLLRGTDSNFRTTLRPAPRPREPEDSRPYLQRMQELCAQRGIPLVFLARGGFDVQDAAEWIEQLGITLVQDADYLDVTDGSFYWPNEEWHLNHLGNAAYAEALLPALERQVARADAGG